VDCYSDVLVIREWEPIDPDVSQLKYYARGVGTVRIGWLGEEDEERETLELVKLVTLTPVALAEVRAAVLAHESRSYMYSLTPPAQVRKISDEKAKEIALQAVPGDVTAVAIEKKLGANRFVVEVIAKEDGIETDVIIDMETGSLQLRMFTTMKNIIQAVGIIVVVVLIAGNAGAQNPGGPGTEEFGLTPKQLVQSIEKVEALISKCMRDKGFQ
jgi:uncharacterized membrane protein YkoI